MKKLLAIILFSMACGTTPKKVAAPQPPDLPVVVDNGKDQKQLVLTKEEFLSIYHLAQNYVALRDSVKGATVDKNVTVVKIADDVYNVTIKLDEQMSMTAVVHIDNTELNALRAKMKKLTTATPVSDVEKIGNSRFRITLSVDDVKFTTIISVEESRGFDLLSFIYGSGAGMVLMFLVKAFVSKGALLPFL